MKTQWLGWRRCWSGFDTHGRSTTPTSRALEGLRILLADDDADSLDAIATILEVNGAEVCRCRDGAEARALLPAFRPHLVVSDLAMPVEDGFEMIAAIRSLSPDRGGQTPAIAARRPTDA